jgi:hypothetical protein
MRKHMALFAAASLAVAGISLAQDQQQQPGQLGQQQPGQFGQQQQPGIGADRLTGGQLPAGAIRSMEQEAHEDIKETLLEVTKAALDPDADFNQLLEHLSSKDREPLEELADADREDLQEQLTALREAYKERYDDELALDDADRIFDENVQIVEGEVVSPAILISWPVQPTEERDGLRQPGQMQQPGMQQDRDRQPGAGLDQDRQPGQTGLGQQDRQPGQTGLGQQDRQPGQTGLGQQDRQPGQTGLGQQQDTGLGQQDRQPGQTGIGQQQDTGFGQQDRQPGQTGLGQQQDTGLGQQDRQPGQTGLGQQDRQPGQTGLGQQDRQPGQTGLGQQDRQPGQTGLGQQDRQPGQTGIGQQPGTGLGQQDRDRQFDVGDRAEHDLEAGDKIAVVTFQQRDQLPTLNVSLVREDEQWKLNLPEHVDADTIKQNLTKAVEQAKEQQDQWPEQAEQAASKMTHAVMMALYDVEPRDQDRMPGMQQDRQPGQLGQPGAGTGAGTGLGQPGQQQDQDRQTQPGAAY